MRTIGTIEKPLWATQPFGGSIMIFYVMEQYGVNKLSKYKRHDKVVYWRNVIIVR